jgi:DNA-binding HxlR family transcriptional regulator
MSGPEAYPVDRHNITETSTYMHAKPESGNMSVCPKFHKAVELIGRRWTGAILSALLMGATRFTDIIHAVPGLSDRLLSERLKELEAEGIVRRIVHPETPVRIEYQLTEKGHDLHNVTNALSDWATRWASEEAEDEVTVPRELVAANA